METPSPPSRRRALGDFLRIHRERQSPETLGLGVGGRRRTPGLRREEVAMASGISLTWYTWLEQGRDISVSSVALARLAATLRLSRAERSYLFELVGKPDPDHNGGDSGAELDPVLTRIIDAISHPAYLLDRIWSLRAWNGPAQGLFSGWLEHDAAPNLLRFVFLDPLAPRLICDWEERASRLVAEYRADFGHYWRDDQVRRLVEDLCDSSALFAREWRRQAVVVREGGPRTFHHPTRGVLRYDQQTFTLASRGDLKLVVLAATG